MRFALQPLLLLLVLALPAPTLAQTPGDAPPEPSMDRAEWAADITALYAAIRENHPDYTHTTSAEDWDAAYEAFLTAIPEMTWPEFVAQTHRFVANTADGHTNVYPPAIPTDDFTQRYPVSFYIFEDGLYVTRASEDARDIIGGRVTHFGGRPVEEVMPELYTLTSGGSPMWPVNWAPHLIRAPGYAKALGVAGEDGAMTVTVEGGASATFLPQDAVDYADLVDAFAAAESETTFPRWWTEQRPYSFTYRPEDNTIYVPYQEVQNWDVDPMDEFADRMFAFIEEHDVQRLIIDVRNNGGGDNTTMAPLVHGVIASDLNRPGGVYVLTGRQTFSAAQNFVTWMERHTQAIFVGEPTGGRPNHYGDATFFTLPHTHVPVIISTLPWFDSFASDPRPFTRPDVAVLWSYEDFLAGRDPVLEAALTHDASDIAYEPFTGNRWRRATQLLGWDVPFAGWHGRFEPDGTPIDQ